MKKIKINMLSFADKVAGQGVGSAYLEQVNLIKEGANDLFDVVINDTNPSDIVHVHSIEPNNYLKMRMTKGKSVTYVHFLPTTLDGSINLPRIAFAVFKWYVIRFYNKSDHLVVVNPIFIRDLVNAGIDARKVTYIPNYVSKEDFYPIPKERVLTLREKLNISQDAFVCIGVGQVQTRKGVIDFVETAKRLPDVTFIWCGGFSFGKITDGYEELKAVVENPPANVKFLGIVPREEMNDMFNVADVLFMPSLNELFPMAILEAVNIGKPLLLRDLELYENILFHKYLKGSNVEEFTTQIMNLKNDQELYKNYSNKSLEISQYYSKENVLAIWRQYYLDVYHDKGEVINEEQSA